MTKARDFAMMVGRSEAINPTRVALLDGDAVTVTDSAVVSSIIGNAGTAIYDSLGALPVAGLTAGQQAFVSANNRLYISNGNGWYNVASVNATPTLATNAAAGTIALTAGTPLVITLTAADSDNADANLALTLESGGDLFKFATVSQDSSVVTITPRSEDSASTLGSDGSATLTFKASDGISVASVVNTFTLSFGPDWATDSVATTKLKASDPQLSDQFGQFVAISGDGAYAIVGAPQEDAGGNAAGAAYIYVRSGNSWSQQQKILSSNIGAGDEFGCAVSINSDGTYAIVGAWAEDTTAVTSGSAYIFTRSGTSWTQQAQIQASPAASNDYFGISVEITPDANYAIVGGYFSNGTTGAAWVFTRSGTSWSQQAKLVASDAASADYFGWHVAISSDGSYAIVGANGEEGTGNSNDNHGAAYIYVRSGTNWTQQAKIQSSDTAAGDKFGWRVAMNSDGTYAAVTSYLSPVGGVAAAGGVYVFTRSGTSWTQQAKLVASDAASYDFFGKGLAINSSGDLIVIGVRGNDRGGTYAEVDSGAVFIFTRSGTTWSQIKELNHTSANRQDYLGESVGMSTDASYIIAGAYGDDTTATNSGAAYIFKAG